MLIRFQTLLWVVVGAYNLIAGLEKDKARSIIPPLRARSSAG